MLDVRSSTTNFLLGIALGAIGLVVTQRWIQTREAGSAERLLDRLDDQIKLLEARYDG
jgi:hypothetical protein